MKIESFTVYGLHSTRGPIHLDFKKDLNILSGKNGAGKTTILKMIWYFISGNLEKAYIEAPFKKAILETNIYTISVNVNPNEDKDFPLTTTINIKDKSQVNEDIYKVTQSKSPYNYIATGFIGSSFFLPTFRIIEGGFTTEKYNIKHEILKNILQVNTDIKETDSLENSFKKLSLSLSKEDHNFLTSISSSAINELLVSKYAENMSKIQPYQKDRNELINKIINNVEIENDAIKFDIDRNDITQFIIELKNIENNVKNLKSPLNRFESTLKFFIKDYRVNFGQKINFTRVEKNNKLELEEISNNKYEAFFQVKDTIEKETFEINSLSAGEKQILSFLAYNAFFDNTIFFIDEPEISLHADWQRILFRMLLKQNPTNQFIISTHSPFIYSKYPDKEVCIDPSFNRGNEEDFKQDVESTVKSDSFLKTDTNYKSPLSRRNKKGNNNE
ncbi:ATP-binding protein [Acinetobacter baumannii]|nr:ATP-binding protein [Acinetobacter baumannii]MDO7332125.1 AAA family ATPase [Acinetobacter baumannii]